MIALEGMRVNQMECYQEEYDQKNTEKLAYNRLNCTKLGWIENHVGHLYAFWILMSVLIPAIHTFIYLYLKVVEYAIHSTCVVVATHAKIPTIQQGWYSYWDCRTHV